MIGVSYTVHGQTARLAIPLLPGESWEDGFARVCPIIRDAMGIKPASEIDPIAWAAIRARAFAAVNVPRGTDRARL